MAKGEDQGKLAANTGRHLSKKGKNNKWSSGGPKWAKITIISSHIVHVL